MEEISILTVDMCPGQYGYGLPFRSQANANEKPILPLGSIAILPEGNPPPVTFRRAVSHSLMLSISMNYFRISKDGERRLARGESGVWEQAEAEQPAEDPAEEAGSA